MLTLVLAGMDAFNPCAFFVLLFLLSLLVHAKSRTRMAIVGGTFVLFSGLVYFVFMAAWLNVFLIAGELRVITIIAGCSRSRSRRSTSRTTSGSRKARACRSPTPPSPGSSSACARSSRSGSMGPMLASTVLLAIVANSYELLCTAGFPMVYTRALTLAKLEPWQYYAWLAAYNVIYVMPLLAIVIVFTRTMGARKLTESEGRILKLVSGFMMLGFGLVLLFAPNLLTNPLASILVLAGGRGASRWWPRRSRPRERPDAPPAGSGKVRHADAPPQASTPPSSASAPCLGPAGCLEAAGDDRAASWSTSAASITARRRWSPCPASTADVSEVLAICNELGVGVVPHGGNTSYCGGATPARSGERDRAVAARA